MDESQNAPPRFTLPHDKVWLRPDRAYFEYRKQAHGIDHDEVEYNGKYRRIRELRDLAVLGLSFHAMQEHPCFVQMNILDDSPDAFLMTHVSEETNEIAPVEITFYGRNKIGVPTQPLLEKLSAPGDKFDKLPPGYWLLVHIGKDLDIDYQAISNHLMTRKAEFSMFSVQEVSGHPDTIARVVTYNPQLEIQDINIGEICYNLSKSKGPGIITIIRGRRPKTEEV
jgi:hypothetical protein